jgi:glycine/D-amino acid oxidase-like deaminating enzyme
MSDAATRSYWLGRVPYEPSPPLEGSRSADVVVVGAGMTGLWSAILLKDADPALEIAVVEQKVAGYGASGRGGGLATGVLGRSLPALVRRFGTEGARAIHRAMRTSLREIVDFADSEGIHAQITSPGLLTVSTGPGQDALVEKDLRAAAHLDVDDLRVLDRGECLDLVRCEPIRRGYFVSHGLLLDPAALARGLKQVACRRGVRVYEQTPVDAVETIRGQRVEARTPFGTVHADRAIVATSAYAHAMPALRRWVYTGYVSAVLTEPLSDERWRSVGWDRRMGIEDRRAFPHSSRPTPDGRILWAGGEVAVSPIGPNPGRDRDRRLAGRLEDSFRRAFPQLREVGFAQSWALPACGTADGLPVIRWLRGERILAALVPAREVGAGHLVGKIVRDAMMGERNGSTALPLLGRRPLPLPPGPLRSIVLDTLQRNLAYADEHEGEGGVVAKVARELLT